MRRMTIVVLVLSLGLNAILAFQLNQKHWELVRKEQGFLLMSLTQLASHIHEMRHERQLCPAEANQLSMHMYWAMSSKDPDVASFYREFFEAWHEVYRHAGAGDAQELIDISLVVYGTFIPLSGSSTKEGALNQKNKRLAALSLVEQLKGEELWDVLTEYRPELDRLSQLISH